MNKKKKQGKRIRKIRKGGNNLSDKLYEIVKNNLYVGLVIKNYKLMCELLEDEEKNGKGRNYQFINWKRFFDFIKEKQKFIITKIFTNPKPKIHNKNNNNRKNFTQFEIPRYNENKTGVYSITLDNNIYIGSTVKGFRERFREHTYKNNPLTHTYEMIQNGGIFKTLWIARDGTEESIIRQKEKDYIEYYIGLSEWNVINLKYGYKIIYNNIKVKEKDYNTAIEILQNNNIHIK